MAKTNITKEIILGEKITAQLVGTLLKIKGPKGEIQRDFNNHLVSVAIKDGKVIVASSKSIKREKTIVGAFVSHIKNMIDGVKDPHVYKLKICSGHFPMNVAVVGNELVIKNFFGETVPRKTALPKGAEVKVSGNEITITSVDLEAAGLAASRIENLCRITNRDLRIFQDGIYITQKPEKKREK